MTLHRLLLLSCLAIASLAGCKRTEQAPAAAQPAPSATVTPQPPPPQPQAQAPATTPSLRLATVDGRPYDLAAHRGKWVVVNFWATWCAPCLKEMPELSALDAMREHVEVIGLAYEEIEPTVMQAFLKRHPVVYPIAIVDVYAPPADFATPRGLPTTYLIAPDGKVAKHFLGPVTAREIDAAIAAAGGPKAG